MVWDMIVDSAAPKMPSPAPGSPMPGMVPNMSIGSSMIFSTLDPIMMYIGVLASPRHRRAVLTEYEENMTGRKKSLI